MNRRFIIILISLLGVALVCIILIQLLWILNAYRENSKRFELSVNEALGRVAGRLEEQDAFRSISHKIDIDVPPPVLLPGKDMERSGKSTLRLVIEDKNGVRDTTLLHTKNEVPSVDVDEKMLLFTELEDLPRVQAVKDVEIDSVIELELNALEWKMQAEKVSGFIDVFKKMVIEVSGEKVPIEKRLNNQDIRDELSKYLLNKGVDLPFEFAVVQSSNDSITSLKSSGFSKESLAGSFAVSLFPDDLLLKPYKLLVSFPGQRAYIYKSFSWMMISSILFTVAIMLAFAFTLHLLLRQKKLTDMKSDFINNLTHEFKTPIATIAVALDSIENPKVINDPEKILPITRLIREENLRMNSHVEQVLQIAMLDTGKLALSMDEVDVSILVLRASEAIKLRLESRSGSILLEFKAAYHTVKGDELHLYNVILNLLDNAIKYSITHPEIRILTGNYDHTLYIRIEDNGRGMNQEEQKKIFDRFYRVPTGNIHTVKGFGLGLSYSKAILEAHGGSINLNWSEPGKGSCFEIRLPLHPFNDWTS